MSEKHSNLIIKSTKETIQDAFNIINGTYAPLTGFLRQQDFQSVLDNMRLANGSVWSIPVVFDVDEKDRQNIKVSNDIIIVDTNNNHKVILKNIEIYPYNKDEYAQKVFGTTDLAHPGVNGIRQKGDYLVGGDLEKISDHEKIFPEFYFSPEETKKIFKENGWKTVVAFQTRNVPHRSHEFLQKKALEQVDGLFINPVIGKKKIGDFKDEVILRAYQKLIDIYYPKEKVFLGILPMKMNYAGPREAIFHALIRKNFGCTHMIIGRDHAGVGSYYDPYAAHRIFDNFSKEELGIEILKFKNASFCRQCGDIVIQGECRHADNDKVFVSGTKMREMIQSGQAIPEECMRPEINKILLNHPNPFV
ncbi:sulfate adenylyltransferase [Candidatus Falkowbacteria bacterium CG10_big_fil_rev_8_21_14_0_10_44_15]|uniref:Sulfate adenylyltransferase n=1 Tax=Candidatus Falkowbacteria bacterium CG10_big_fil_rev_8_21_14_0_10_44_15 TaxID=1974569 RepID=A0A2H0V1L2_9BACT|nr:MAG: sulfate adenylyltransferase [Candidatus Falkowbacteria bacterium CG10_big_fil_rev_8_21_14_0_10_44_15]